MDETKQTSGDSSQTNGDSSNEGAGITSQQTPETFTKADRDKAVSDALSAAGRTAKALSELETRLNTGMAELKAERDRWQKARDEAEEEAVMDDPTALASLRTARQKKAEEAAKTTELTKREAKLAKRETELADIVERDRILTRTQLAAEVAVERGVSMDAILKLAKEDTREAYEAVAEVLPKTSQLPVLIPASSKTNRGGIDIDKLSPREKIEAGIAKLTKK